MYWEGPQLLSAERAAVRAAPERLRRHAALRRVPVVGRRLHDVGDAEDARAGRDQHRPLGHSVLGHRHRRLRADRRYTGELHVRWFQFGTFCPSFRAHGRNWHLRLPWGWNMGKIPVSELRGYTGGAADPDPAELNNPASSPSSASISSCAIACCPYTYTIARECTRHRPAVDARALAASSRRSRWRCARGDQFLWGRDMLVSPVVEKGATSRRLYLPRGAWFDFWTEERLEGGREIDRKVDLETMPLHVRAGAILPLGPVKQYVDEPVERAAERRRLSGRRRRLLAVRRRRADVRLSQGRMDANRDGRGTTPARVLSVRLAPGSRMLPPAKRLIEVRVAGAIGVAESGLRRETDRSAPLTTLRSTDASHRRISCPTDATTPSRALLPPARDDRSATDPPRVSRL